MNTAMDASSLFGAWSALFRRRKPAANPAVAIAMCVMFVAPIAASAYFIRDPASIFWTKSVSDGGRGGPPGSLKAVPLVGAAALGPGDPVVRFSETRIGQVLYAKSSSDNCERVLFDNRTGATYDALEVFCGQTPGQMMGTGVTDRFSALRKSFQR